MKIKLSKRKQEVIKKHLKENVAFSIYKIYAKINCLIYDHCIIITPTLIAIAFSFFYFLNRKDLLMRIDYTMNLLLHILIIIALFLLKVKRDHITYKSNKEYEIKEFRKLMQKNNVIYFFLIYFILDGLYMIIPYYMNVPDDLYELFVCIYMIFCFFVHIAIYADLSFFKILAILSTTIQGVFIALGCLICVLNYIKGNDGIGELIKAINQGIFAIYLFHFILSDFIILFEIFFCIFMTLLFYCLCPEYQKKKFKLLFRIVYISITIIVSLSYLIVPSLNETLASNTFFETHIGLDLYKKIVDSSPADIFSNLFLPYVPSYLICTLIFDKKSNPTKVKYTELGDHDVLRYLEIRKLIMSDVNYDELMNEIKSLQSL